MRLPAGLLCAVLVAACSTSKPALHGTVLSPAPTAKPFTLVDQYERKFSLSGARGTAVALYFGFAHCKDVCPQTLALLGNARARAGLTPDQLRIVMVTVDPNRDNAAALRGFFARVGVRAIGLTGTPAQLRATYRAYGIEVQPEKSDIGHTDDVFVIDREGRLRELLDPHTAADAVAQDLRTVVE
jgi:protein SCO1